MPEKKESRLELIESIAKRRGFFWPAAEIYGGIAGFWNYGPLGTALKNKLVQQWRKEFVKNEGAHEIETTDILPEIVWVASGHAEGFNDKQTVCKKCKNRFRADHLIEDIVKDIEKLEGKSCEELTEIIKNKNIKCPKCGGQLDDVAIFNLMFDINLGPKGEIKCYLKPETTQSSVIDFPNVYRSQRGKLPIKIAQIGRSFRNEISPRQIFIRMREFNMAELQIFFNPEETKWDSYKSIKDFKVRILPASMRGKDEKEADVKIEEALKKGWIPNELIAYYIAKVFMFFENVLKIDRKFLRFKELLPEERAHYAKVHWDFEVFTEEFGWKENVNNAWRSDYDLKRHQQYSKQSLEVFENEKHVLPNMYEPSFGIDRMILHLLLHSYKSDEKRVWMSLPKELAPFSAAIFPLVNKDGIDKKAEEIYESLKNDSDIFYDESGSIGRRYARADEIGIPFCVTIDHQTLEDGTVTIRERDTTKQERVKIEKLKEILNV
ncbi:MAG: glycine--tRNA ligase [Candidatus Aenigmatarchaeota archaeon]